MALKEWGTNTVPYFVSFFIMVDIEVLKNKISTTLTDKFEGTDLFIVDIRVTGSRNISVFIDDKQNIPISTCVEVSRFLENFLESNDLVHEKYKLEVSSPGMDEPFKVPQQYQKWINQPVEVLLNSGVKEIGKLKSFDDESITIELPEKKKKKEIIPAEIKTHARADIKYTRKHFVFK